MKRRSRRVSDRLAVRRVVTRHEDDLVNTLGFADVTARVSSWRLAAVVYKVSV
jgi:hypothetical protein